MDAAEAESLDWDPGPTDHLAPPGAGSEAEPTPWDDRPWGASTAGVGSGDSGDRVAELETALGEWQRRAVIWRERARSGQVLNEALRKNLEDLRVVLHGDATLVSDVVDRAATPATPATSATSATQAQEQWWTRVFRRDFWVEPR
jgi:hypothetical protein